MKSTQKKPAGKLGRNPFETRTKPAPLKKTDPTSKTTPKRTAPKRAAPAEQALLPRLIVDVVSGAYLLKLRTQLIVKDWADRFSPTRTAKGSRKNS